MSETKFSMNIEEFEFSTRTYNCLKRAGICTLEDLTNRTCSDMFKQNLGRKGFEEILFKLRALGLDFKDDDISMCPSCKCEVAEPDNICTDSACSSLTTLEELNLSVKEYAFLEKIGIHTVEEITSKSYSDLVALARLHSPIGVFTYALLDGIVDQIQSMGLFLQTNEGDCCPVCHNKLDQGSVFCVDCAFAILKNKQLSDLARYAAKDEDIAENEFDFKYSIDDKGVVIDGYLGFDTEVVIPERIAKLPVYKIGDDAFSDNEKITKIILPESVQIIGNNAFCGSNLELTNFPNGLTIIGDNAFSDTKVHNITIPQSLESLGEGAFSGTEIETLLIPDNVKVVPIALCDSCERLHTVVIQGATTIGSAAFENCSSLENVFLPDTLMFVEENAFNDTGLYKLIFPASVKSIGKGNYPDYADIAILGNSTQVDLSSYGEDVTIYCSQTNNCVRQKARDNDVLRKPLSYFPKD